MDVAPILPHPAHAVGRFWLGLFPCGLDWCGRNCWRRQIPLLSSSWSTDQSIVISAGTGLFVGALLLGLAGAEFPESTPMPRVSCSFVLIKHIETMGISFQILRLVVLKNQHNQPQKLASFRHPIVNLGCHGVATRCFADGGPQPPAPDSVPVGPWLVCLDLGGNTGQCLGNPVPRMDFKGSESDMIEQFVGDFMLLWYILVVKCCKIKKHFEFQGVNFLGKPPATATRSICTPMELKW